MTENQLNKLRNRLLNIQTQLNGASIVLQKEQPLINYKVQDAVKIVSDVYKMLDTIKTCENPPGEVYRKKKLKEKQKSFSDLTPHEVIISRSEPPTYNKLCRHYSHIETKGGHIERTCEVGMDLCYCSMKCAYATNNVCSTNEDGRIGGRWR